MHPRRLEKNANITLNSALFQIEINETKRSTSYFFGMGDPVSSRLKSAADTRVPDNSGKLFIALACL